MSEEPHTRHERHVKHSRIFVCVLLTVLLIIAILFSLSYGKNVVDVMKSLWTDSGIDPVVRKVRLPRTLLAFFVGGSLGICGVILQSILRNPLAEPYTLGLSGGATFGVTLSALIGLERYCSFYANPLMGFAGAMASVMVIYLLARKRFFHPNSMILFGIVVSLVFSAVVFFLFSILDPDRMQITLMWLMGDLSSLDINLIPAYIPLFLIPAIIMLLFGKELDILSLGSEKAQYLGINPPRMYKTLFLLSSIVTGLCVSASGVIGFVGLVVPHILRTITGASHSFLLLSSYLGGAFFLITSDIIARYLLYPVELPVGVVTAMLGGLTFLTVILRRP